MGKADLAVEDEHGNAGSTRVVENRSCDIEGGNCVHAAPPPLAAAFFCARLARACQHSEWSITECSMPSDDRTGYALRVPLLSPQRMHRGRSWWSGVTPPAPSDAASATSAPCPISAIVDRPSSSTFML